MHRAFRFATYRPALVLICLLGLVIQAGAQEVASTWYDRQSEWNGFNRYHFTIADRPAYLVVPQKVAPGRPWVWRARFPNYHAEMDIALLQRGFHLAYIDVADLFGSPRALDAFDQNYEFLTTRVGLTSKVALEGVSRGGLFVYNWAARHPERVACIYADTPVLDFKSWPGGRGAGVGSSAAWKKCLAAYELDEDAALKYSNNPIDHAAILAHAKIPLLHVVSENDQVVPPAENTYVLKKRLEDYGHELEVISLPEGTDASRGHHFEHPDPDRVVAFIENHAGMGLVDREALLENAKQIVFLGDSITYAGQYTDSFAAWLLTREYDVVPTVINVGLPSETVSGLSEDGHAGGRFPRPDLAERLERVLSLTKPDLVFACYGINCGIYQPFSESRFESYQRGINALRDQVSQVGASLVLITPPTYDDARANREFSYNGVLDRYSQWLIELRNEGVLVVDLHGPMTGELMSRRKSEPEFTFQPDAVHPNAEGHWLMARVLFGWFGDVKASSAKSPASWLASTSLSPELLELVRRRQTILRDSYLSNAGHTRPGISSGLPLDQALAQAKEITRTIARAIHESQ